MFGFVLETDVTFGGTIFHRSFREVEIDDWFAIHHDFERVAFQRDGVAIPFARGFHHVFGSCLGSDNATAIVMIDVFFSVCIEDLQLHACIDRQCRICHAHEDAGVACGFEFEFQIENEISVKFLGHDVIVETFPTRLAFARFQRENIVGFDDPVACGFPAGEIFAVKEIYEAIGFFAVRRKGEEGGSDENAQD